MTVGAVADAYARTLDRDAPRRVAGGPGVTLAEPYVYPGQVTLPETGKTSWVVPDGALFVLGDHRQDSRDSRTFGPVPIASVIGRAWLSYWPLGRFEVLATPMYRRSARSRRRADARPVLGRRRIGCRSTHASVRDRGSYGPGTTDPSGPYRLTTVTAE